ncbi:MAG: glycerol-3-phosphate 1-O-acyltransferase PlsY [Thermodesulfobacteriota bacterium]
MLLAIAWIALAYLIGSMPFGLFVAKAAKGIDPREGGSRNIGATNVARLCGAGWGVLVLALDIAKGWVPVAVAQSFSDSAFFLGATALAAVSGHIFSVFLHGKGGKAVATTVGVFLALAPSQLVLSALACILAIALSGYVSLGSLTLVTLLPALLLFSGQVTYFFFALAVMVLVYWRHKENIQRLVRGEEKPWRKPKEQ